MACSPCSQKMQKMQHVRYVYVEYKPCGLASMQRTDDSASSCRRLGLPAQANFLRRARMKLCGFNEVGVCHETVSVFYPSVRLFSSSANGGRHLDTELYLTLT